ncbi:MAG TPA: hypothetical protein VKB79_04350 [Bryobacteraceae bacterium]|nr:hypothetical protein [Bryobacteraceae bacterium]
MAFASESSEVLVYKNGFERYHLGSDVVDILLSVGVLKAGSIKQIR